MPSNLSVEPYVSRNTRPCIGRIGLSVTLTPRREACNGTGLGPTERYGLKNRSRTSSSCLLSEARTRICRTTVPEMRGENPSGVLWQREQFCWKTRVPSSWGC